MYLDTCIEIFRDLFLVSKTLLSSSIFKICVPFYTFPIKKKNPIFFGYQIKSFDPVVVAFNPLTFVSRLHQIPFRPSSRCPQIDLFLDVLRQTFFQMSFYLDKLNTWNKIIMSTSMYRPVLVLFGISQIITHALYSQFAKSKQNTFC